MFHFVVTGLTLIATLLHAVLGCCSHHAHAGHTHCASAGEHHHAAAESEGHTHRCCHAHHEQPDSEPHGLLQSGEGNQEDGERHAPGHDSCDEGTCQFVWPSKVSLPSYDGPAPFATLPARLVSTAVSGGALYSWLGFSRSGLPPTLGVHDLTQVWRV